MTYVAAGLIIVVVLLVLAMYRQGVSHQQQTAIAARDAAAERSSLLDRIQHPTVRQVEPVDTPTPEPPRDAAEMAHIGMIVPDFVQVGTEAPNENGN